MTETINNLLRLLLIEDSEEDAELLLRELSRVGYNVQTERVDSAKAMKSALERQPWDLVISDYVIPGFGGLEALELCRQKNLKAPFIVVSGQIGEDIAVTMMKAGADDYLMKDRLARLAPAVARALSQAEIRCAHQRANDALRESEERFRELAENIGSAFFMFERPSAESPGTVSYVSPAFERIWGLPSSVLFRDPDQWIKMVHPDDRAALTNNLPEMFQRNFNTEFRIVCMDRIRWIHYRTFPVIDRGGKVYRVAAIAEDISERKKTEEMLSANARQLQRSVEDLRALSEELRQRNEELSMARAELEQRVLERTSELSAANAGLRAEMSERKRLENELLEIAENERRSIGFDLHDDIGQKLMGVSLMLKAIENTLSNKRMPEAQETRKVQHLIEQVMDHTHNLAHCFSSFDAQGDDLGALLKKLGANIRKTFRISCQVSLPEPMPPLSQDFVLQLYKIAQESVSNAVKHGKATRVQVKLGLQGRQLQLEVKNDGVLFPVNREPTNRMGLRIMNFRARTIGGVFDIGPGKESGAVVTCKVPILNSQPTANGKSTYSQEASTVPRSNGRVLLSA
jgi:two-component system sensor histidine kinase UhpB